MKNLFTSFLIFLSINLTYSQTTYPLDSTILTSRTVIDSIDVPWEIKWGPDNHIWMTERFGRVSRVNPNTGQQDVILNISSQIYADYESGLLGMALHPDFSNQPYVYLVYTYLSASGSDILERLVKYNYNGTSLVNPITLIDSLGGNTTHIGSRLFILPDSTMLMSSGDTQNSSLSQDTFSLTGKILRINLDGSIPANNPIPNSYVWSIGFRNTQGICLAPNGLLYASEHGPTSDDELNILKPNRNFGWPTVAGACDSPPEMNFCNNFNVVEPIFKWTPTIAPSDLIWYDHPSIPEFKNKLLMTVLKDKKLVVFNFNTTGDSVISEKTYFDQEFGRLRDICTSPDGKIYLATNGASWSNTDPFTHSIIELSNENYTKIHKNLSESAIQFGPNPIKNGESLKIDLLNNKGNLEIYDLVGKLIYNQELNNKNVLNISLNKGIYIWNINLNDGNVLDGKLIVNE